MRYSSKKNNETIREQTKEGENGREKFNQTRRGQSCVNNPSLGGKGEGSKKQEKKTSKHDQNKGKER